MKKIYIILFLLFNTIIVFSQDDETPEKRLDRLVNTLLSDYETYGQLVADYNNPVISEEYKEAFKDLFALGTKVFNDIIGSETYGQEISVAKYVEELEKQFPSGLSVSLVGRRKRLDVTERKTKGYPAIIIMQVSKEFEGRTKDGEYETDNLDLFITIGISQGYEEVAIVDISNEFVEKQKEEEKAVVAGSRNAEEKARREKEKKRKKYLAGLKASERRKLEKHQILGVSWNPSFAQSRGFNASDSNPFFYESIESMTENWTLSPFAFSAHYQYFINSDLGFGIGLGIAQSKYHLEGDIAQATYDWTFNDWDLNTTSPVSQQDIEVLIASNRNFSASALIEKYNRTTIEIPLSVIYKKPIGESTSLKWFVSGGIKIDLELESENSFEGQFNAYNNYIYDIDTDPEATEVDSLNVTISYLNARNRAESGVNQLYYLYDDSETYEGVINPEESFKTAQLNIWAHVSAGVQFRLLTFSKEKNDTNRNLGTGNSLWLSIAPNFQYGFFNISNNDLEGVESLYRMRRTEGDYGFTMDTWDKFSQNGEVPNNVTVDPSYDEYRSLFRSQDKFGIHSFGLNIGLFYELGKKRRPY